MSMQSSTQHVWITVTDCTAFDYRVLIIMYSSFHDTTVALKPNQQSKPSTIWAAVLKIEKRADGPKKEEDYLWIKCHAV